MRVPFLPKHICGCPVHRLGYAGVIEHRSPCSPRHEYLSMSGDPIVPGKKYRWFQDGWPDGKEINAVAVVTRVEGSWVFAFWGISEPDSDQFGTETCVPSAGIVEEVL